MYHWKRGKLASHFRIMLQHHCCSDLNLISMEVSLSVVSSPRNTGSLHEKKTHLGQCFFKWRYNLLLHLLVIPQEKSQLPWRSSSHNCTISAIYTQLHNRIIILFILMLHTQLHYIGGTINITACIASTGKKEVQSNAQTTEVQSNGQNTRS
jgi:hypothetical protein